MTAWLKRSVIDLPQEATKEHGIIPHNLPKSDLDDPRPHIAEYLKAGCNPNEIIYNLSQHWGIQISPQKLGGYISAIKRANLKVAKATMKDCSETYLEKPLGQPVVCKVAITSTEKWISRRQADQRKDAHQSPTATRSALDAIILPKKATEAEIMTMYNKEHFTPSAIAQILEIIRCYK
jgi:hypothetical protein